VKKCEIAIIGGGVAGLDILRRLHSQTDIHLFEAAPQLGGRCYTLFDFFDDGLLGELGPLRILSPHKKILDLIKALGLELIENKTVTSSLFWLQENSFYHNAGENLLKKLPYNFSEQEIASNLSSTHEIALHYYAPLLKEISSDNFSSWPANMDIFSMDQLTIAEWLIQQGASIAATELFNLGAGFAKNASALFMLRQLINHNKTEKKYHIKGGMGQLITALSQNLASRCSLDSKLISVKQHGKHYILTLQTASQIKEIQAEKLVFALPFSALRNISLNLNLPTPLLTAISELRYASSIRVLIQVPNDFRVTSLPADVIFTHHPMEILESNISLTTSSPASKLIVVYIKGDYARQLEKYDQATMLNKVFKQLSPLWPDIAKKAEKTWVQAWGKHALFAGSYPTYAPGQMTGFNEIIQERYGHCYFAGDHASTCPGWLEGAVRSSERVTQQILSD
jgi:monoamine oxidase